MKPPSEMVHWLFATGFLLLGLFLLAEALAGQEAWAKRRWRLYLWPGFAFGLGVLMWPVMAFFTSSAVHMLAHGAWAQALMAAGGAELGLARGKLHHPAWRALTFVGLLVSGAAFLVHEQNGWLFARAAFLHHLLGWTLVVASVIPLARVFRPRSAALQSAFALTFVVAAVLLFCDRDIAPVFGHLSPLAGNAHR
ncbi:MAG TPA: hypothetical protein VK278_06555 [Gaiellaceae bacterium]|nr:hypothetical protein [Gaiellaceae bacterium]